MLLQAWEKKPHELAREVYQKGTNNSAFVSTYAYSLLVQQKAGEALKIIEDLPENPKGIPPRSPGLRAASYPGKSGWCRPTPTGLWRAGGAGTQPLQLCHLAALQPVLLSDKWHNYR